MTAVRPGPATRPRAAQAGRPRARQPVPEPRAVVARVQRPGPPRGARRAQPAPGAGEVPDHLRQQPRRVLPGPRLRTAAPAAERVAGPGPRRADAGRAAGARSARASWSSITEQSTVYARLRRPARGRGHRDRRLHGDPGAPRRASPALPRRDLPGADPARRRPGPSVPVHLARSACRSRSGCAIRSPGEQRFARVKIPPILPRLIEVEPSRFVLIDQVIEANLDELFRGMEIVETHLFRVTRDADLAIEEDEADDLLLAIEEELRRRRFGEAVRLEVERSMPATTRADPPAGHRPARRGLLRDLGDARPHRAWASSWTWTGPTSRSRPGPRSCPRASCRPTRTSRSTCSRSIRTGDLLVHHPYESFSASTERFVAQAADDPDVLTIKQTLYRTSGDSPIVRSLIRAAERGKQVVVLVEIKARFDEEANIIWARRLEQAGAHVVYGLVGLKTHSKVCLVVRREGHGLRRYVHIGTGNYNAQDGPPVRRPRPAVRARGAGRRRHRPVQRPDRPVAPDVVPPAARRARSRSGRGSSTWSSARWPMRGPAAPARIVLKTNAHRRHPDGRRAVCGVATPASRSTASSGARVCLLPGVAGLSERIRVRSVVGEFLEHSRIWMFENGGRPRVVHRLGRPHGPEPGSARGGGHAGRGPRGAGAAGPGHRR